MFPADAWTRGGEYESYVGRWSRGVARQFVRWLSAEAPASWLDVGCGTGALAETIVELASPSRVVGVDPSEGFLVHASARMEPDIAAFAVADAHALPFADASFDACVSGLVLNFLDEPAQALDEMKRVVQAGGTIAAYVWDYAGEMQFLRKFWDAAAALDPSAADLDEGRRFQIAKPDALAGLFARAGLNGVETRAIEIETRFLDFDDLWSPFLGGQGPAPGYVASLSEEQRAELADRLRTSVPMEPGGSIALLARAWAVRATG